VDSVWLCGCKLLSPLGAGELLDWLTGGNAAGIAAAFDP
jgi:hypothetical protein